LRRLGGRPIYEQSAIELGHTEPPAENLSDNLAIKDALPEVSRTRFEQTLCAEFPYLTEWLLKLREEKTLQNLTSLADIWKITESKAIKLANQLTEVGFFESRGTKENPEFWVPFLYRAALDMVQGTAELDGDDDTQEPDN
jgi:hypothetical protein